MKIAVIGATGAVGREMLAELEEAPELAGAEIAVFASPRSEGISLPFAGRNLRVNKFELERLRSYDYVLLSAGREFSKNWAQPLCDLGLTVVDNSSAWRKDEHVPLIVPEVNGHLLAPGSTLAKERAAIIANPNCSTIQLVVSLLPLRELGVEQVIVSTYQSVSGSGNRGITEMAAQVRSHAAMAEPRCDLYKQPIAFNVLSAIGAIADDGHCEEEEKMVQETRKIWADEKLDVLASTARVGVFHCHCESVCVRLSKEVSLPQVTDLYANSEVVEYAATRDHFELPSPRTQAGDPAVFVSRLRLRSGESSSRWLQFWNVADNLKKGAATNAVQIVQALVRARG